MSVTIETTKTEAVLIEKALLGIAANAFQAYQSHEEAGHEAVAETYYDRYEEVRLAAHRVRQGIDKHDDAEAALDIAEQVKRDKGAAK